MPLREPSWFALMQEIVERMPERFKLHDLDPHFDTLRRAYPHNRHISDKVRQLLQRLRDKGIIEFTNRGEYRRLVPRPEPTVRIDFNIAAHLTSLSQRAKIALESWTKFNLWCNSCGYPNLLALPPNAPVSDFRCPKCRIEYQVKAQNKHFRESVLGAAYEPCYRRALDRAMPDYLLIEYSIYLKQVIFVDVIRGRQITPERVLKRPRLREGAQREGWIGCHINIEGLQRIPIVAPMFVAGPRS